MALEALKHVDWTPADIRHFVGHRVPIALYENVAHADDIEDVMGGESASALMYEFHKDAQNIRGHWTALLDHGSHLEFFDPGGFAPDAELQYASAAVKAAAHEGQPYLVNLIRASGKPLVYNHRPLQASVVTLSTCGRHVAVRLAHAHQTLDAYTQWLEAQGNPDDVVVRITYSKIHK